MKLDFKFLKKLKLDKHKKTKIGLVFGGGGARGFVHLGVLKAFEEYGLKFDVVVGTSVGSIFAAMYAAGKSYDEMLTIVKNLDMKDIRTNIIPYKTSKTEGIEKLIKDNIGDINIEQLNIPYAAVCTDLKTTKEYYVTKGNLAKAISGSCCLPYIFYPVEFGDCLFVDGGLHNTIPADIPKLMGCDYVIAVDPHSERTYGTDSKRAWHVIACSFRILMEKNARKGYKYADLVLSPDTHKYKLLKKEGYQEMIETGYRTAVDNMPQILSIYNKKPLSKKEKRLFMTQYKEDEAKVEKI